MGYFHGKSNEHTLFHLTFGGGKKNGRYRLNKTTGIKEVKGTLQ
jgi:hypothetical protein